MSSYVLMKILESSPERYDRGIRMLDRGRIDSMYEAIADAAARPGARVLDIGCGTGNVSLACAARGARVIGIDINAGMLEVARTKPPPELGSVEFLQAGAAEIEDHFPPASFDSVVSCLAFSEMSADERVYALRSARRVLSPNGRLVIADETIPRSQARRVVKRLRRLPSVVATWVLTQTTTRALPDPVGLVRDAGFEDVKVGNRFGGDLTMVSACRPTEAGSEDMKEADRA